MIRLNDRLFLREVLESCQKQNVGVWIFGGWAEELWRLSNPRIHKDIDLLYPARDFGILDAAIHQMNDWEEILLKRFPHKRAIRVQGIMVEFFLVQSEMSNTFTNFFGSVRFDWPDDTFNFTTSLLGITANIASQTALGKYRSENDSVRRAYREYIGEQGTSLDSAFCASDLGR